MPSDHHRAGLLLARVADDKLTPAVHGTDRARVSMHVPLAPVSHRDGVAA